MSRFDDEGAPLISRVLRERWSLPVHGVARVAPPVFALLRRRLSAMISPAEPPKPASVGTEQETPAEAEEGPETYDEHGELIHPHHPPSEAPPHHNLDLKA